MSEEDNTLVRPCLEIFVDPDLGRRGLGVQEEAIQQHTKKGSVPVYLMHYAQS